MFVVYIGVMAKLVRLMWSAIRRDRKTPPPCNCHQEAPGPDALKIDFGHDEGQCFTFVTPFGLWPVNPILLADFSKDSPIGQFLEQIGEAFPEYHQLPSWVAQGRPENRRRLARSLHVASKAFEHNVMARAVLNRVVIKHE